MYKVMLVDDEPVILEGLKRIIKWEEHGLEISAEALNGVQALEILEKTKVNILLTDIKMPEMDGLELIRKIKLKNHDMKFIILSGYDDFCYVKESIKLGIENYILKPVNEDELSSTLINIVEKIELELHQKIKTKADDNILRENIFHRWIGNQINPGELEERASLLNINLCCNTYIVCVVRMLQPQDISGDQDIGLLKFAIQNICNEIIDNYGNVITFNDITGDIILIFSGNNGDVDRKKICDLLVSCIANVKTFLKTEVFISAGSTEKDSSSVYKSYLNAKSLMEYSLKFSSGTLFDYEKIRKNSEPQQIAFEAEKLSPLIRRVLNYIDLNYSKDISLKALSSQFSVNAAYLGQLFKNETGEMFSPYLNNVRIKKAKELLINSKLNAKEISLKVGYSNENYFYNIFKKVTGKYPTEYKRDLPQKQI